VGIELNTETSSKSWENLRQLLIESGTVTASKLEEIVNGKGDAEFGQLLVESGIITPQQLAAMMRLLPEIPSLNLNTCEIQPEALQLIPESLARKYNVMPLAITGDALQVAIANGSDILTIETLTVLARRRVELVIASAVEIQEAINRNYKSYREIEEQFSRAGSSPFDQIAVKAPAEANADAPVVRALELIVNEAIKGRASDIHIEPEENRLRVRYRIDGVLHETVSLPLSAQAPLISRIKIMANMNIADHRPQDGQFSVRVKDKDLKDKAIDIRVATITTSYGEMAVLRVLDKSFAALSLNQLGFLPGSLEKYQRMLGTPFGMVLISGPTGSGKTTTLYASINGFNCKERNIITVEDPIEYRFKGINQIQINPRAGLTFASGLRSIMRLDPNVILVGEIRDSETAKIAVQAALTGHLVLASIHANDSVGSLYRLLDLGVEPFLVAAAVIGGVAQRMVRRICPHCRRLAPAPAQGRLAYLKEMKEERTEFFQGSGCNSCANTGYLGRVAAFEVLPLSDEIRRLLLNGASAADIRAQAEKEGMVSMLHDGMLKVKDGLTTPGEVLRCVFSIE
jgi:general secretion pathway protein E